MWLAEEQVLAVWVLSWFGEFGRSIDLALTIHSHVRTRDLSQRDLTIGCRLQTHNK